MKNIFLLISVSFIFITGCKKEKLFKHIEGNWKITKVVYSGGTLSGDSVVMNNPNTSLYFKNCSAKEDKNIGNCTGKFQNAGNEISFNYSFQDNNEINLGIYASPPSSNIGDYNKEVKDIAGMYEILELTASKLRIQSTCCTNWPVGAETYRIRYIEATQ